MTSSRPTWHQGTNVNQAVEDFYHKYARQPAYEMSPVKWKLQEYLTTIRSHLQQKGLPFWDFEFVGGSYEGLKVNDGLEFDVFMVLDGRGFDVNPTGNPEFHSLIPTASAKKPYLKSALTWIRGHLSAEKMARKFQSYIDTLRSDALKNVVFRKHGPAIQMDVKRENGAFWFSVDLVPAYVIDGEYYVAKVRPEHPDAWLHSYSVEMKRKFDGMNRDNGRRKQVLRTLKALCHRVSQSTLHPLSSHHLKMLLLTELKEHPYKTWRPSELGLRLLDLLARLERYLADGRFPHYFLPRINMIDGQHGWSVNTYIARMNLMHRIHHLYNSEVAFMKALHVGSEELIPTAPERGWVRGLLYGSAIVGSGLLASTFGLGVILAAMKISPPK